MKQIHNREELKDLRKYLRNNLTPAEATLWKFISHNQLGRKFRRQHSINKYILDFYCPTERLAIELDGDEHFHEVGIVKDKKRDEDLREMGISVLRFENDEVLNNLDYVLDFIKRSFKNHP